MSSEVWNRLAEERERLQPTPPVSEPVIWYQNGDKRFPVPALCSAAEGPGRIKVTIYPHGAMLMHRSGCHHITHPVHDKPNETTKNCGSWDYPRGVPKEDYKLHEDDLTRRENGLLEADEKAKEAAKLHEQKAAEREKLINEKLGKGKKKPEPVSV